MRYWIILLFTFSSLWSLADGPVNIGIKYGTNSSVMMTNFDMVLNQNLQSDQINNHFAGAFLRLNAGPVYAQPEVYFNTKGGIIKPVNATEAQIPSATTFNYQSIDLPILLGYKIINRDLIKFRFCVGPVFTFVTANSFYTEISNLNVNDLSRRYMGWQIGAGLDIWFITLDARIENSSNILAPENQFIAKNRAYLLSVGIKLF
jgi:hypothetical protein